MANRRSKRGSSFNVVFWIAAILLVAIILVFNLPQIREVLERTDFVEVVFEDRPAVDAPPAAEDTDEPAAESEEPPPVLVQPEDEATEQLPTPPEVEPEESQPEATRLEIPERAGPERDPVGEPIRSTLYFIRVTDDARIVAEPVTRELRRNASPLTRTIEALLAGPGVDELNRGLLTLVPPGSRLLSARVENGVAYLNFSEEFRFNEMGLEGNIAQVQQVVLTATQFATVSQVQVLINGQRLEYLSGDGVYVGAPLSPSDFRN